MSLSHALVSRLMLRDLRRAFRRVCWVGPPPALPPGEPVVAYANHHAYHDGFLMHLLIEHWLGRTGAIWMEEWDRFPLFAATGAQPFPADEPQRRAATVRRTARRFREQPDTILAYFPEGRLHPPEDGLLPFPADVAPRIDRLLPACRWWPVGIHVTWWGEARPTALLTGGTPHARADGSERERLDIVWRRLHRPDPEPLTVLLEGATDPSEGRGYDWLRPFFERFLRA